MLPKATSFAATTKPLPNAGAAILYLLMRDAHGRHTVDVKGYREVVMIVKKAAHDTMMLLVKS